MEGRRWAVRVRAAPLLWRLALLSGASPIGAAGHGLAPYIHGAKACGGAEPGARARGGKRARFLRERRPPAEATSSSPSAIFYMERPPRRLFGYDPGGTRRLSPVASPRGGTSAGAARHATRDAPRGSASTRLKSQAPATAATLEAAGKRPPGPLDIHLQCVPQLLEISTSYN